MKIFEQSNSLLNLLSDAISEGVVIVDDAQNIVSVNNSLLEMFGYTPDELLGKHLNILIPKNIHADHKKYVTDFVEQSDKRQMGHGRNLFGIHKSGINIPVEAGLNPFTWESKKYVMALVIDISIRKQQEEKIIQLNTELEEKIQKRTKELKHTVDELQKEIEKRIAAEKRIKNALKKEKELNELKTKFLSMVSHEFKTPLSGILTSTILLGKYKLTEQQDKRDKHLRTITEKVHYLNNILNDFLSIERLDTGKINYKPTTFKLSKVINEVVYNANMLLKSGQKITFPPEVDEYILTQDEKIMELCLSNLIHNAIKYSPEDSLIEIQVEINQKMLTIQITDEGMGIPEVAQKHIFSRYFRAENATNDQGTGIGLNIVKGHLKNLGGKISFVSEENKGTTFTMSVPLTHQSKN
ncbi:PAS domain-containing sensor histidine kinase [uncultured Planktosalinus sp.]|uniref:PAS domain-containing sensor histidine kinase n=1 Tax=uncultured Planktosalinus sp. TaxID=1810935 RepID=UPI0030DD0413